MQLTNTETNVLLVALDDMEEEILDLMKRTRTTSGDTCGKRDLKRVEQQEIK